MQIYLSGVVRDAHLDAVTRLDDVGVVIDFSYKDMRDERLLREALNHFKGRGMPLIATHSKSNSRGSDEYLALVRGYKDFFELIHFNADCVPEDMSSVALVDIVKLEDIEGLIGKVKSIGITKSMKLTQVKAYVSPLLPYLRTTGTVFHAWARADKASISSGVFKSSSSASWISGGRYGNTYNYVGNLRLVTHHGSKGQGKSVRLGFATKCKELGIDHDRLMADDLEAVNLWNARQWDLYAKDASLVSGYWTNRMDVKMTSKKTKSFDSKDLEHELALPQQRALASQDAGARYLRSCDNCFLSSSCPAFAPQSACRISTRPKVDTPEDIQDLLNRIIEIQGERVMFAAFAEKAQNMGANPDVSKEMETLTKLVKDTKEIFSVGGDEVTIKAKGSGVISKIFGSYGRGGGGGSKPSQSEKIIDVSPLEGNDD